MVGTALVVGGSIGGLASGLALLRSGIEDVQVFERAPGPLKRGAGVGLDDISIRILQQLLSGTSSGGTMLSKLQPMRLLEERASKSGNVLLRHEYPYHAVYWEDVYSMLLAGFQEVGGKVHFGCKVVGVTQRHDATALEMSVVVLTLEDGSSVTGDLVVGADGPHSKICPQLFPDVPERLEYRGYFALRGTLPRSLLPADLAGALQAELPDLGNCLYFILGPACGHLVLYQLGGRVLNWLMYVNRAAPVFAGHSQTTGEPPAGLLDEVYDDADRLWGPAIAQLIRLTPKPFVNDIYDRDPLQAVVSGQAVLVGDSAHPITPHVAKGTCLAIQDAYVLGRAVQSARIQAQQTGGNAITPKLLSDALTSYEQQRLPESYRQVLLARHKGRVRNCLADASCRLVDFSSVSSEDYKVMLDSAGLDTDFLPSDPALRLLSVDPRNCAVQATEPC